MNSTPNTSSHQTSRINRYSVIIVAILAAFLLGYVIRDLFYKDKPASGQAQPLPAFTHTEEPQPLKVYTFAKPESLEFAGEPVPLDIPDVWERLDYEIHLNIYFHSSTISILKRAHRWLPEIEKVLKKNNIPEDFKFLPLIESGLENVVSHRQAVGFWQLREATAKELGLTVNNQVDERYDPIKSTEAACKYLQRAYEKFGNWTNVAASYNIGMYGLQRNLDDQQVSSYYDLLLNQETARYVFRILAIKEIKTNPKKYGYDIPESHLYRHIPTRTVVVSEDIKDLASFAIGQGINYKILKKFNPWLRKQNLNVRRGETYEIKIPVNASDLLSGEGEEKGVD